MSKMGSPPGTHMWNMNDVNMLDIYGRQGRRFQKSLVCFYYLFVLFKYFIEVIRDRGFLHTLNFQKNIFHKICTLRFPFNYLMS